MKLRPILGIGDLLILKMRTRSANIQVDSVNVMTIIAHTYRKHSETYLRFLEVFLPRLFPGAIVEFDKNDNYTNIEHIRIIDGYIYPHYTFSVPRVVFSDKPYIIIHTRARFDGTKPVFFRDTLPLYGSSLSTLRSEYPILLFGERDIEDGLECRINQIHSMYKFLMQIPGVIDMTRNSSASSNSIEEFERDIHFINGAKCNVVFGYGGPLSLSVAFGRKTLGYIGGIQHSVVDDYINIACLYRNIDDFSDALRIELS